MQIKDIAQMAGVAPSTVSRVINHSGYVSTPVRYRVEAILKETGYVPNSIAKSLKSKKSNMIGLIIPQASNEAMTQMIDGVTSECNQAGYQTVLANTELNPEKELEYLKELPNKRVDGLIFYATHMTRAHHKLLSSLDMPVVVLGQVEETCHCVVHDDFAAAKELTQLLIEKGYRKIGFINVDRKDDAVRRERYKGYKSAVMEAGLVCDDRWLAYGDYSIKSGVQAMKYIWTMQEEKPDAVLAVTDYMAAGAIVYLRQIGLSVPEDCAVAGIGNDVLSGFVNPPLTTVKYHHNRAGRTAARVLFRQLGSRPAQVKVHVVPHKLIERSST